MGKTCKVQFVISGRDWKSGDAVPTEGSTGGRSGARAVPSSTNLGARYPTRYRESLMKLCQRETVSTADLDRLQAIAYADFAKHAMNVVFHGLLRKTQFLRNLFVRATAADHSY
jgi:hypothetical protein